MLVSPCQTLREICRAQLAIKESFRSRNAAEVFVDVPAWIQAPRKRARRPSLQLLRGDFCRKFLSVKFTLGKRFLLTTGIGRNAIDARH